jgi:hypothetical protein
MTRAGRWVIRPESWRWKRTTSPHAYNKINDCEEGGTVPIHDWSRVDPNLFITFTRHGELWWILRLALAWRLASAKRKIRVWIFLKLGATKRVSFP